MKYFGRNRTRYQFLRYIGIAGGSAVFQVLSCPNPPSSSAPLLSFERNDSRTNGRKSINHLAWLLSCHRNLRSFALRSKQSPNYSCQPFFRSRSSSAAFSLHPLCCLRFSLSLSSSFSVSVFFLFFFFLLSSANGCAISTSFEKRALRERTEEGRRNDIVGEDEPASRIAERFREKPGKGRLFANFNQRTRS